MIKKDIQGFANANWNDCKKTITEISTNCQTQSPLVVDDTVAYDFDMICKKIYGETNNPTSTDCIFIRSRSLELIEFKSGFKQIITKENFDQEKGTCKHLGGICNDYWNIFFENQKRKINELISSIRIKAIESYVTLEKQVFPLCEDCEDSPIKVYLTIVIDEDEIDSMEDTLDELAGNKTRRNNCFSSIRQALSRLNKRKDQNGYEYYYDKIEIISSTDYMNSKSS